MARVNIIWDHGKLTAWRRKGKSAVMLAEAPVEKVEGLLDFLKTQERKLRISHLAIYLDHGSLDHHVERLPPLSGKLQRQLMAQRKETSKYIKSKWHLIGISISILNMGIRMMARSNYIIYLHQ